MSSRLGKRPLGSHSRGHSPPDKRSRPSEPRSALQDRYATLGNSKIPSPPPSRKSSFAGLPPKLSTGHQLSSDRNRSVDSVHGKRVRDEIGRDNRSFSHDARVVSPSSIGSGASTLTNCVAPPVPSMLPAGSRQHSSAMHDNAPISMQSLRKLKDRRRAIANGIQVNPAEVPSTVNNQIEAKLKAQQLDISQLRKESDTLTNKLKTMEESFERFNRVANRVEQEDKASEALSHIVARLGVLETSSLASDVHNLQQDLGELKPKTDQLATITAALPSLQEDVTLLKPILGRLDVLDKIAGLATNLQTHKKDIELAVAQAAEANSAVAKITGLEADYTVSKHTNELQKIAIDTLSNWKNAQPQAISEETMKKLVMAEVLDKTTSVKEVLRQAISEAEKKLYKRISDERESVGKVESKLNGVTTSVEGLRQTINTVPQQLTALHTKAQDLETNNFITYNKASRVEGDLKKFMDSRKSFERFEKDLDQCIDDVEKCNEYRRDLKNTIIPNLQKSAKRLEELDYAIYKCIGHYDKDYDHTKKTVLERLTKVQASIGLVDIGKLVTRVEELERLNGDPAFRKAGTAVTSPSSSNIPSSPTLGVYNSRLDQLAKDLKGLRDVLQGDSGLKSTLAQTDKRLANVEQALQKVDASNGQIKVLEASVAQLDRRVKGFPSVAKHPGNSSEVIPLSLVDSVRQQMSDMQSDIEILFTSVTNVGETVHEHDSAIKIAQNVVPELFGKHFDPFKSMVEKELSTINEKLVTYAQVQQCSFDGEQQSQLRALAATTTTFRNEMATLQSENQDRIAELARKADTVNVQRQIDAIVVAFRDLESRYQNISTDELHQRMVHWFTKMYPTSATLMHHAAQARQDINQLKKFHDQVAWILSSSNELRYLTQNTTQLRDLVDSTSHLQHLVNNAPQLQALVEQEFPHTLAKLNQACTEVQTAMTEAGRAVAKVDEHVRTNENAMTLLHASMQQLTSADSPFAKAEALRPLETAIQTLQTDLRTEEAECSTKLQEVRKIFSDAHDQRVQVEKRIKGDMNMLKSRVDKVINQVDEVQTAASQHRSEFNEVNNTLIQPNRDLFGLFGTVLTILAQLQQVVENMNQNLPVAPLKLEWEYYLPALGEQAETNGETSNGNENGEGKSKQ